MDHLDEDSKGGRCNAGCPTSHLGMCVDRAQSLVRDYGGRCSTAKSVLHWKEKNLGGKSTQGQIVSKYILISIIVIPSISIDV